MSDTTQTNAAAPAENSGGIMSFLGFGKKQENATQSAGRRRNKNKSRKNRNKNKTRKNRNKNKSRKNRNKNKSRKNRSRK